MEVTMKNGDKFGEWAAGQGVSDQHKTLLLNALGKIPPDQADALIDEISSQNLPMKDALPRIMRAALPSAAKVQQAPQFEPAPHEKPVIAKVEEKKKGFPGLSVFSGGGKKPAPASKQGGGKKPGGKMILIGVAVVVILALAFVMVSKLMGGGEVEGNEAYPAMEGYFVQGEPALPTEIVPSAVPDQGLTGLSAEDKSEWAASVLKSTLGDPALNRPVSWSAAFSNFPWLWLVYILGAPVLLFMVYRDRSQAQELSDIKLANRGFWFMFLATVLSEFIAKIFIAQGMNPTSSVFTVLAIGAIGAVIFQWSAVTSGKRDYSVLAVGVFSTGLLIKWWLSANATLAAVAMVLMVVGMFLLLIEIRRNANEAESDTVMVKSLLGTLLMAIVFVAVFGFIFITIDRAVGNMPIPVDIEGQARIATQVALYTKGQMPISLVLGAFAALGAGLVWGAIALRPANSKSTGKMVDGNILGLISLDADMMALFVMILWFLMPWVSLLPTLLRLFI